MVACACNPSIWQAEAGGIEAQITWQILGDLVWKKIQEREKRNVGKKEK